MPLRDPTIPPDPDFWIGFLIGLTIVTIVAGMAAVVWIQT